MPKVRHVQPLGTQRAAFLFWETLGHSSSWNSENALSATEPEAPCPETAFLIIVRASEGLLVETSRSVLFREP